MVPMKFPFEVTTKCQPVKTSNQNQICKPKLPLEVVPGMLFEEWDMEVSGQSKTTTQRLDLIQHKIPIEVITTSSCVAVITWIHTQSPICYSVFSTSCVPIKIGVCQFASGPEGPCGES